MLGHGILRAIQRIENELAKKGESYFAGEIHSGLPLAIHQDQGVALLRIMTDINEFTEFDIAGSSKN
jgi:hypothetical protein